MTTLQSKARKIARARFRVESHCRQCAASLEQALRTTDGVYFAAVLAVSGETVVDYDPALMSRRDLQEAIEAACFPAVSLETLSPRMSVRGAGATKYPPFSLDPCGSESSDPRRVS